jgi:hypothetical protein
MFKVTANALPSDEYQDGADGGQTRMRFLLAMLIISIVWELPDARTMVMTRVVARLAQRLVTR